MKIGLSQARLCQAVSVAGLDFHRRRADAGTPFVRGGVRREETDEGLRDRHQGGVDESPRPLLCRREGRQRQSHELEF